MGSCAFFHRIQPHNSQPRGGAPADGFYGTAVSRVECAAVEKVKAVFLNEGIVGSLVVLSDSA